MSERERILANGGDVQCVKCFAIGDGRSFSPPYEVCDSCAQDDICEDDICEDCGGRFVQGSHFCFGGGQ